jgi:hypothetical protein
MYLDALLYPIRRGGWVMILAGAIFSVILEFLTIAPAIGLLVMLFSAGYFGSFYLDIVSTTMAGRDDVPDWPNFGNFWDDIFAPFARLFVLVVFAFGPWIAVAYFADSKASWHEGAFWGTAAYGCIYFPMSVLAAQAFGSAWAALPHVVFPGIVRALPGYLLTVVCLIVAFVGSAFGQAFASKVPYVGWLLTVAVSLYAMMFQGRLIGLIYIEKQHLLGWE